MERAQTPEGADINTSANRVEPSVTDRNSVDQRTFPKHQTPSLLTPKTLPTPVKIDRLKAFLEGYNQQLVEYIVKGFKEGFSLCSRAKVNNIEPKNLKSAYLHPEVLDDKIKKEVDLGRLLGPFDSRPFDDMCLSPIGLQQKKSGDFRMITHLSHPKGSSVNDGISKEFASVKYATLGKAITIIKKLGKGCYLAKTDIKSAFRIIPVRPSEYKLLGFKWRDKYFIEAVLPQGAASSCRIFETFSTAIEWIARNKLGIPDIIHILDDFLWIAKTKSECKAQLNRFLSFCDFCSIPIAADKTMGPEQVLPFAGIELNTVLMQASLPIDKLEKCRNLLTLTLGKNKISLKEIQELTGLLNFCCVVVYPGRPFLRRLYNLSIGLKGPYSTVPLSHEIKEDVRMWLNFLTNFNGKNFFMSDTWIADDALNLHSDAAQTKGYGATLGREWLWGAWPNELRGVDITTLEFYPIAVSLIIWGPKLSHLNLNIHTDNEALVSIINNQTVKNNELCLKLLRIFVLTCLKYSIYIKAFHIPGVDNSICDALSRLQVDLFKSLAPNMNPDPIPIPKHLLPIELLRI